MNLSLKNEPRASLKENKREAKKVKLADSALAALSEYGYANTSLRDIAKFSGNSLGVVHYYFENKEQLLIFCVERYKDQFIADINKRIEAADGSEDIVDVVASALVLTLIQDAKTHRLWYDMRSQAMYDPVFKPMVDKIETGLRNMLAPLAPQNGDLIYTAMDGLFRFYLQNFLAGNATSAGKMEEGFKSLVQKIGNTS